jgi:hypothetical protein
MHRVQLHGRCSIPRLCIVTFRSPYYPVGVFHDTNFLFDFQCFIHAILHRALLNSVLPYVVISLGRPRNSYTKQDPHNCLSNPQRSAVRLRVRPNSDDNGDEHPSETSTSCESAMLGPVDKAANTYSCHRAVNCAHARDSCRLELTVILRSQTWLVSAFSLINDFGGAKRGCSATLRFYFRRVTG